MSHPPNPQSRAIPKRKQIFFKEGLQLRYAGLVAGSLTVLLIFACLYGFFVAKSGLAEPAFQEFEPYLRVSAIRLFVVGLMYVAVFTLAAIFLSHRAVGPTRRLEDQIRQMAQTDNGTEPLRIREGDDFEGLVEAINLLVDKAKKSGKK